MGSDYETLRVMVNGGGKFPAVIGQNRQGDFGFFCGAIPTELAGRKYKTAGDAVYAFVRCEAVQQGAINAFQIEENGHISKPYRRISENKWAKDDGSGVFVATIPA